MITHKGEQVKSKSEWRIANILRKLGLEYEYERPVPVWSRKKIYQLLPDFYLNQFGVYIEFWGMISDPEYKKKMSWKKKMYNRHNIQVIHLYPYQMYQKPAKIIMKELKKFAQKSQ
ncbi:MAG: hypothetical protein KJI71_01340 [Patescibacteria group bacterium]|nr:hypothetical protein [Patescibacteria group bacterium]